MSKSDPTAAECLPSKPEEISALASAQAPFIVFDDAPLCGLKYNLGMITLTAERPIASGPGDGSVVFAKVVVGNLRGTMAALLFLRQTIDAVIAMEEAVRREEAQQQAGPAGAEPIDIPAGILKN